jgi:hypothetical protein
MAGHHLILGKIVDFITGDILKDTHDERYRQKLTRLLVEKKGYHKKEIEPRFDLLVKAGKNKAIVKVDFVITLSGKACMIIKYGPGSLVTRYRPALAASRLLAPYQIPIVVVTNGEDAAVLEGTTGNVISHGLESIPFKSKLIQRVTDMSFNPVSANRAELESRIIYTFEVDGSCPCDDTICKL